MFVFDEVILVAAAEMRRATGYAQAQELRAIAEFARRHAEDEFAYLEIATLLHISDRAAQQRMRFALELVDRLRCTLDVLLDGQIEEYKAQLIAEAVSCLTDEQAHAVEARVLPDAAEQTPGQLRAALAKAVMTVDPEGAEKRRLAKKRIAGCRRNPPRTVRRSCRSTTAPPQSRRCVRRSGVGPSS